MRVLQLPHLHRPFRLSDQLQYHLAILVVPQNPPVRIVLPNDLRELNPERQRELEVADHLLVVLQSLLHKPLLRPRVHLSPIIQAVPTRLYELLLRERLRRWEQPL